MRRLGLALVLTLSSCSGGASAPTTAAPTTPAPIPPTTTEAPLATPAPTAPLVPDGPVSLEVAGAVARLLAGVFTSDWDREAIADLADLGDARVAWLLTDLLRFYQTGAPRDALVAALVELTGAPYQPGEVDFVWAANQLIAWDLPAWDGYREAKARLYLSLDEGWRPFFEEDHGIEWRWVTWGGVLADRRPLGDNGPCNCIPALDDPATTDAAGGNWYPDDSVVFGVVVGGEALALPRHQMEVHEMVNVTLGGGELGIPYCTLCGSAQTYLTDQVPGVERVVLRTSGLLSRSNKLMYDLTTGSAIDTFTGRALSGPLGEAGVTLDQVTVVASTWGAWKQAHPETRILAEDGGVGRSYPVDPLGDRDDTGPIFPVGDIDPRLPAQEAVVGVIAPGGTAIAFPVAATRAALEERGELVYRGLTVTLTDGIRGFGADGQELPTHQAFWFAWSQFHPGTLVWSPTGS